MIPGYSDLEHVGEGGMGVVYAATEAVLGRRVAIKTVRPGAGNARFVREAEVTARLPHPNIPPVHALVQEPDGRSYLVMKLVEGETLAELLKDRPSPAADRPRWVGVFGQVCQAVGFAHARGVVHRDLKPQNVMIGAEGEVQVMDWGLAGASGAVEDRGIGGSPGGGPFRQLTRADQVMGTPAYMAPEQARGEAPGARADVFALGGLLCLILTGRRPYRGRTAAEMLARARAGDLTDALVRLDGCAADPDLVALAKRCLAPDPADRPADGAAVAAAVTAYQHAADEARRRAEAAAAAATARADADRRRRRTQAALAVAVLVLVTGAALGAVAWTSVSAERREAAFKAQQEEERERLKEEGRQERARAAVSRLLGEAGEALEKENGRLAEALLAQAEKQAADAGLTEFAARTADLRDDLRFWNEVEAIDDGLWELDSNYRLINPYAPSEVGKRAYPKLREAFRTLGITPGETDPAVAAARITRSVLRDTQLYALELMHATHPHRNLRDLLSRADPDPFRENARRLIADHRHQEFAALVGKAEWLGQPTYWMRAMVESDRMSPLDRHQTLVAAVQTRPGAYPLLMFLGDFNLTIFRADDHGAKWYLAAAAAKPDGFRAQWGLGMALSAGKDYDGAARCFEQLVRLRPNSANAHVMLGQAYSFKGARDLAVQSFRRAADLNLTSGYPRLHLGRALMKAGDQSAALESYRVGIRLSKSTDLDSHVRALSDEKNVEVLIIYYSAAVLEKPGEGALYERLSHYLRQKGDDTAAEDALARGVRHNPDDVLLLVSLGNVLWKSNRLDEAIELFRRARDRDPLNVAAHTSLGDALFEKKSFHESIRVYQQLFVMLHQTSQDKSWLPSKCMNKIGLARRELGDLDGAAQAQRAAVKWLPPHPQSAPYHVDLGVTLKLKGDLDDALVALTKAVQLQPENISALSEFAQVQEARGDLGEAVTHLQHVLRLSPGNDSARQALGRVSAAHLRLTGRQLAPPPRLAGTPPPVEVRLFAGHTGLVHNLALTPDGRFAASVGADRAAVVWLAGRGTVRHKLLGSPDQLYAVAVSPDGKLVAAGGQDYVSPAGKNDFRVRVWDADTGAARFTLAGHAGTVSRVAFADGGRALISSAWDRTVRRWDVAGGGDGKVLYTFPTVPTALLRDDDRKQLLVGTSSGDLYVLRDGEPAPPPVPAGFKQNVQHVARVSDRLVAAGGQTAEPTLVDLETKTATPLVGHTQNAEAVDAVPGGKYVVTGGDDQTVRVWRVADAAPVAVLRPACGMIRAVRVMPGGGEVLCAGGDGTLRLLTLPDRP